MTEQEQLLLGVALQRLVGGTVIAGYDIPQMVNYWEIKNDDIGYMKITASDECLFYESIDTRLKRMCEEYDGYMRYKLRDYKE